jgi:hypothetical protein
MRLQAGTSPVTQFDSPKQSLAGLSTEANAALLSAAADLVLVVDGEGVVQDVSSNTGAMPVTGGLRSWVGKSWQEVVTIESRPKVAKLLNSSGDNRAIWRQVNVPAEEGADIPISFCSIPVGPKGRMIALGRDLRAQSEIQQQLVDAQQVQRQGAHAGGGRGDAAAVGKGIVGFDAQEKRLQPGEVDSNFLEKGLDFGLKSLVPFAIQINLQAAPSAGFKQHAGIRLALVEGETYRSIGGQL